MAYDIHTSAPVHQLLDATKFLNPLGRVIIDGDGANVWGERVGENGNDPTHLHVIVRVDTSERAEEVKELILDEWASGCSPFAPVFNRVVTVTEAKDWSEQVAV